MHTWTEDGSKAEELHEPLPTTSTLRRKNVFLTQRAAALLLRATRKPSIEHIATENHRFSQKTKGNCYLYKIII